MAIIHTKRAAVTEEGDKSKDRVGRSERSHKAPGKRRLRKLVLLAAVAGASLTALVGSGSSAFAGTVWQSAGASGSVVEANPAGRCYNTAYGYGIVATGPTVYGFNSYGISTEIVRWTARLYDASTNTFGAWDSFSPESYVNAYYGHNFNSTTEVLPGIHGHVQYAQVAVEWLTTAGGVVGYKTYYVSSYQQSGGPGGYPVNYCEG